MKLILIGTVLDKNDDNVDVQVEIDRKRYVATIFTIKKIISNYKTSGECLNGKYFWASDMLIVDNLEEGNLKKIVQQLIFDGEFYDVFKDWNKYTISKLKRLKII